MTTLMLQKDAQQSLQVRIGACRPTRGGADCGEPRWIGQPQAVEVDTRVAAPTLALRFPSDLSCVSGTSAAAR
jgi:hypothetical protein